MVWKGLVGGAVLGVASKVLMARGWTAGDAWTLSLAVAVVLWSWETVAYWAHRTQEGFENREAQREVPSLARHREEGILYSGDLVEVECLDPVVEGRTCVMQRDMFASEVMFGPVELANLSKLRVVLPDHDTLRLKPVHYGDVVHLAHSGFTDNRNEAGYLIKRARTLVSHQKGEEFAAFRLRRASDVDDSSPVMSRTNILFEAVETGGLPAAYLCVREDHKVDDAAGTDISRATRFRLRIVRPAELGDRHLDLAPGEILFP